MPFADRNYTYAESPASLFPHLVGLPDERFGQTPEDVNFPNPEQYFSSGYRFDDYTGSMTVGQEAYPILPLAGGAKSYYPFNIFEREERSYRSISTMTDPIHQAPACSSTSYKEGAGPTRANNSTVHERDQELANPVAYEKSDKRSYTSAFPEGSRPVETATIPKQSHTIYRPTFQNHLENAALVPCPIPLKDLLIAEDPPSPSSPPFSISTPPQDTAAAAAAPEVLSTPTPPTPAERLATYARYISSPENITRGDLCDWFQITYQKPLTDSQASSIIHTRGMVPRGYSTNRKHVPKPNFTYDVALERERVAIYEYTIGITRAEGRAPPMTRVSKWWGGQDGGRLLASTTIAGMVAEMRRRGGQAMAMEVAKSQGKKWAAGDWEAMDLTNRKQFVKAGMERAHEAMGDEEVDLTGPWCKPGDEAEEAKKAVGRKRNQSELVGGVNLRGEKRRVKIKAPPPLQREDQGDKHPRVSFKLWNWWRKHRDSRRISTTDLQRRAALLWASLGDGNDPMPDFTDYIEWFKNRYQLVTNEGGPYMKDMIYMYDHVGTSLPMRPPKRSQISEARRWC